MATTPRQEFDYLLVGGGLANALIALSLFEARPGLRVGLVEQTSSLGGNHVWCFHAGDVNGAAQPVVSRLVGTRWPRYEVRFPELARTLEEPYAAVRSERLNQVVQEAFVGRVGSRLFLDARAVHVTDQLGRVLSTRRHGRARASLGQAARRARRRATVIVPRAHHPRRARAEREAFAELRCGRARAVRSRGVQFGLAPHLLAPVRRGARGAKNDQKTRARRLVNVTFRALFRHQSQL
jgi:Lycopene cyclase protein